eukprot:3583153-Rhodomonas_salina.8
MSVPHTAQLIFRIAYVSTVQSIAYKQHSLCQSRSQHTISTAQPRAVPCTTYHSSIASGSIVQSIPYTEHSL